MHYLRNVVIFCGCVLMGSFSSASEPGEELKNAPPAAVARWQDMRFGLFVHWGPSSVAGSEISWSRGRSVPSVVYDNLYKRFNPTKFDAEAWAAIARDAGMKYLVFTAKHTDGFCMYDTKQTDYNIMRSPFGRDVVKELAAACRKEEIAFGAYYCIGDWWHPDFPHGSPWGKTLKPNADIDRYEKYMCRQLEELIRGYGPLLTIWFDYAQDVNLERGTRIERFVRSLQPDVLLNDRGAWPDRSIPADYDTSEQKIGRMQTNRPWETCMTIGEGAWSWRPNEKVKSLKVCLQTLIKVVGGGGNFLLNVGPRPDGTIEPEQVERLREIGRWMAKYGESIYGTRGGPFPRGDWGAATQKGNVIYLHILNPALDTVKLPPIARKIIGSRVLTGGTAEVRQTAEGVEVSIPKTDRQEIDTIVVLQVE
jgi:alpha-L-fucosidase